MKDNRPPTFYTDYLQAAEVHIAACKELRKRLNVDDKYYKNKRDLEKIIKEIYYLSGYIIECTLCYALGNFIDEENRGKGFDKTNLLEEFNFDIQGKPIKFRGFFAESDHSYNRKIELIRTNRIKISGIPILDQKYSLATKFPPEFKSKFEKMFANWSPHWRYKYPEEVLKILLEEQKLPETKIPFILNQYIEFVIDFTNLIRNKFNYRTI